MYNIKEIRGKIAGIRNIQKISKAMEMIAASKMHKAQKRMLISRPYLETICKVINNISLGKLEYKHVYLIERKIKCVGYWIISSDRGLAGGLNSNLFRILLDDIKKWNKLGVEVKFALIGLKASSFFSYINPNMIISCISGIGDNPEMSKLIGSVRIMLKLYDTNKVDCLYVAYNKFVNTLSQVPHILQVLPIIPTNFDVLKIKYWDYLYEPNPYILLNTLLNRYIESQVYQGVVENLASEQAARMMAMKTASDNGEILIKQLKLLYNKIRQTKITQELIEIISGASVL